MSIRTGINGFGRMGRLTLRSAWSNPALDFVQINDPAADAATLAHLLNFDSVHGRWHREARHDGDALQVEGRRFPVTRNREPADSGVTRCARDTVAGMVRALHPEPIETTIGNGK